VHPHKFKNGNKRRLWEEINKAKGINGVRHLMRRLLSPGFRRAMVRFSPEFFLMYYIAFRLPKHQKRWVQLWAIQFLLELAPRDHGKSWIFSYGAPLYQIYSDLIENDLKFCKERFLQISKTDEMAAKYADQVRETIMYNTWLAEDFGDIKDPDHWLKSYFSCRRERGDKLEKDHTYEKVGVLGGITGGHFNDINLDDPLDDENTKTTDRMDAIENWFFGTVWNLREPITRFRVVGTRKNRRDLYSTLLKSGIWKCNVEKAIIKYPMITDPKDPDRLVQGWLYKTDTGRHIRGMAEIKPEETIVDVDLLTDDYQVLWPSSPKVDDEGKPKMAPPVIDPDTGQVIMPSRQELWGWGIKELLMDRLQGITTFEREKQNEITAGEEAIFHKDWMVYFDNDQLVYNETDGYTYLVTEVTQQ
jgi:hypothetical protein